MIRTVTSLAGIALFTLLLGFAWLARPIPPHEALQRYEDQFKPGAPPALQGRRLAPLLLGGRGTAQLVAQRVQDRSMLGRTSAIAFLGHARASAAAGVLESIALDRTEESGARVQALVALQAIDAKTAIATASSLLEEPEPLRATAQRVAAGDGRASERLTRWDVLFFQL